MVREMNGQHNKSMDVGRNSDFVCWLVRFPDVACWRFRPTSSQPLCCCRVLCRRMMKTDVLKEIWEIGGTLLQVDKKNCLSKQAI